MNLDNDIYNDEAFKITRAVINQLKKITATATVFEEVKHIDNIFKRSIILTPAQLRSLPKGIKGLVAQAGIRQMQNVLYSDLYLGALQKLFAYKDFRDVEPLKVSTYDFFPEEVSSTIKIFAEVPKVERMLSAICLDNQKYMKYALQILKNW